MQYTNIICILCMRRTQAATSSRRLHPLPLSSLDAGNAPFLSRASACVKGAGSETSGCKMARLEEPTESPRLTAVKRRREFFAALVQSAPVASEEGKVGFQYQTAMKS